MLLRIQPRYSWTVADLFYSTQTDKTDHQPALCVASTHEDERYPKHKPSPSARHLPRPTTTLHIHTSFHTQHPLPPTHPRPTPTRLSLPAKPHLPPRPALALSRPPQLPSPPSRDMLLIIMGSWHSPGCAHPAMSLLGVWSLGAWWAMSHRRRTFRPPVDSIRWWARSTCQADDRGHKNVSGGRMGRGRPAPSLVAAVW